MSTGPSFSIVVPTHQRRDSLRRLLDSVDAAVGVDGDVEVVVVVDGSTDGTAAMLEAASWDVPLRWQAQPNAGRSAARNAGLDLAAAPIVWLVDDDMTVDATAYKAHRSFHEDRDDAAVLVGPQWEYAPDGTVIDWLATRIERLSADGFVHDPLDFWTGNVSCRRATLADVGDFTADFVGWGEEDVELGYRLRKASIPVHYDLAAGATHWRPRPPGQQIREQRERGRNLVRLCERHPEALDRSFKAPRPVRALYRRNVRSPRVYGGIAEASAWLVEREWLRSPRATQLAFAVGKSSARIAGVLEAGGDEVIQRRIALGTDARRDEYELTGMVRQCLDLADPSVVDDVIADAPHFRRLVAELDAEGAHRVPYEFTPAIERLANDPALVDVVATVLGDDQWVAWGANIQIGTPNAAHEWHNDIESNRWPSITVMVGLRGCGAANATRYIPGSHRLSRTPHGVGVIDGDDRVLAAAHALDPRCSTIKRFEGFADRRFYLFDAKGWHCGDTEASTDRLALFLHYQRAADPRVPYMKDFTANEWFDEPAAYIVGPNVTSRESALYLQPGGPPTVRRRARAVASRLRRRMPAAR